MAVSGAAQRPPKAAMLVAQRILQDALRKGLGAGDLLEPERTMLEKYQTGRGTLREALRLLEFQGVISLKPGPRGGPVLQNPDAAHLGSTLVLLMQLRSAPFRNIVEVRSAVEPMISSLAASRMTDEELEELRGILEEMDACETVEAFVANDLRFHRLIGNASRNPVLASVLESFSTPMSRTRVWRGVTQVNAIDQTKAQHAALYDALAHHRPDVARAVATAHIAGVEAWLEAALDEPDALAA